MLHHVVVCTRYAWVVSFARLQILAAMLVMLTTIALSGFLQPFVVEVDDVIAISCHYQLLLTLLMSLVSAANIAEQDGYR